MYLKQEMKRNEVGHVVVSLLRAATCRPAQVHSPFRPNFEHFGALHRFGPA